MIAEITALATTAKTIINLLKEFKELIPEGAREQAKKILIKNN